MAATVMTCDDQSVDRGIVIRADEDGHDGIEFQMATHPTKVIA